MIKYPEYNLISYFRSDDDTRKVWIYFGLKEHHDLYYYADFIDDVDRNNCKFVIFPRTKYTIREIEDEAESYVLEHRREKVS